MAASEQASSNNAPTGFQRNPSITIDHKLLRALRCGDKSQVEKFARQHGSCFPGTTPQGNTALHIAARFGKESAVKEILRLQPSLVNARNQNCETPVHIAARTGKIGVVKILLTTETAEENILRIKDNEDNTPLHNAVRNYDRKLAFMLINKDPEPIQYLNKANQSPLCIAIDAKLTHIACLMINKNLSSLDHKGSDGLTLLQRAILKQDIVVMYEILQTRRELISEVDANQRNPLHYAAALGDFKMAWLLSTEDDSLVYQVDCDGQTPVHLAAKNGQLGVLRTLLDFYPDVFELLDNGKRNILHLAAQYGHADVVKYILNFPEMEDLINSPDNDGNTPLHLAAIHCYTYVIYILSTSPRMNVRITNNKQKTALAIVESSMDHEDMPKFLATKALKAADARQGPHPSNILERGHLVEIRDIRHGQKIEEMAKTLLVMATVIATFTFTAAFTVPGGYNDDGPDKGMATLIRKRGFQAFVITDTIAMTSSITAAVLVVGYFLYRNNFRDHSMKFIAAAIVLTSIGLLSMLLSFITGFFVVLSNNSTLTIVVCSIGLALPVIVCVFVIYFDALFYLHSSANSLATQSDKVETAVTSLFLHSDIVAPFASLALVVRGLVLLLHRDERSYRSSSLRFWIKAHYMLLSVRLSVFQVRYGQSFSPFRRLAKLF